VQFLTLGQEGVERRRPAASPPSAPAPDALVRASPTAAADDDGMARKSNDQSGSSTINSGGNKEPCPCPADTRTARKLLKGGGGGGSFKKGFLLSSSKRKKEKKGRNRMASEASNTSEREASVPMEPSGPSTAPPARKDFTNEPDTAGDVIDESDDADADADADSDDDGPADPLPAPLASPPTLLAVGSTHTVYCRDDAASPNGCTVLQAGTVHGRPTRHFVPLSLRVPLRCLQLSCGKRHVLALMGDGPRIGSARRGLFDGPIVPAKRTGGGAAGGPSASSVRSAYEALSNGIVMSWGAGHFGQLGHGPEVTDCPQPTIVDRLLPRAVGGPVIHVCAGPLHSAAIVATSASHTRSFLFGSNRRGQCGIEKCNTVPLPMPLEHVEHPELGTAVNFVRISLGRLHGVGLTDAGELYSWGSNTNGRLGHGDCTSAGAAKAGRGVRPPGRIDALKHVTIIQAVAGDGHTLALTGSGRVFSWGSNSEGQLGQAHTMNYHSPRLVGDLDFAGIHSTYDEGGKLRPRKAEGSGPGKTTPDGAPTEAELRSSGSTIPAARTVEDINSSHDQEIKTPPALPHFMTSPGAIHAFQKTVPEDSAASIPKIASICASGDYSAALSSAGDLYTFGYGDGNQIGHGTAPKSDDNDASLPYVEPGPKSRTGAGHRVRESCSFDSRLNILLPQRVEFTRNMGLKVDQVYMGPSNMILLCSSKTNDDEEMVGRTLFEIESRRRALGLSKLRMLSAKKRSKSKQDDGINTTEDANNGEAEHVLEKCRPPEKQNGKEEASANASAPKDKKIEPKKSTSSRSGKTDGRQSERLSSPLNMLKKTKKRILKR